MSYDYPHDYWNGGDLNKGGSGYKGLGYTDFPVHQVTFEKLLKEKPESFLEIGSCRGYIVRRMEQKGIRAEGVDISQYCVSTRVARNIHVCDITSQPLPFYAAEPTFDLSFSIAVLEHIPEDKLPHVIKEIARVSKRGVHCPSFNNIPDDEDKTHQTLRDKAWWEKVFADNAPNFPVKIIDKEEMEDYKVLAFQQPQQVPNGVFAGRYVTQDIQTMNNPNPERKICLNIGSFIVMYASQPDKCIINLDVEDLRGYASQNGYNFVMYKAPGRLPFKDNSIDAIYCSHMLEHLDRKEADVFLKECVRVLKPGAPARFAVPDAGALADDYANGDDVRKIHGIYNVSAANSEDDAEAFYHLLLDGHKTVYDFLSLKDKLTKNGFSSEPSRLSLQNQTDYPILGEFIMDMYPEISLYVEGEKKSEESFFVKNEGNGGNRTRNTERTDPLSTMGSLVELGGSPESPVSPDDKPAAHEQHHIPASSSKKEIHKICIINPPFLTCPPKAYGGLEMVTYDLAVTLAKMGKDVTVIGAEGSKVEGCRVFTSSKEIGTAQTDWRLAEQESFDKYKDLLINGKFDVIHDHTWFGYAYLLKQQHPELPICHTHHGGLQWKGKPSFVKDLNLFAISNYMQGVYQAQGFTSKVCYNGIDLTNYTVEHEKGDRLLFVGRLDSFKQPHVAIDVARRAGLDIDVVGGTFVNDVEYMKKVLAMCDKHAVAYPDAPQSKKIELMQRAKALLVPSRMGEPFGLIAVEAMACGTPVIAFDDGALPEIVGQGGFIVKDDTQMVATVKSLNARGVTPSPSVCRGQAERFSREKMTERYLELYQGIVI